MSPWCCAFLTFSGSKLENISSQRKFWNGQNGEIFSPHFTHQRRSFFDGSTSRAGDYNHGRLPIHKEKQELAREKWRRIMKSFFAKTFLSWLKTHGFSGFSLMLRTSERSCQLQLAQCLSSLAKAGVHRLPLIRQLNLTQRDLKELYWFQVFWNWKAYSFHMSLFGAWHDYPRLSHGRK